MANQMTPAELRETAKRLRRQRLIPRNEGSPMDRDLRAGADALDRLADVIEDVDLTGVPEAQNHTSKGAQSVKRRVWRIAHGETNERETNA